MDLDEGYIQIAIKEAENASWPFGAVVVRGGEILAQAGSGGENDPTAHAEVNAIRLACKKIESHDLSGATLYASCEPCVMCFGAAWYAGIRNIVFGSSLKDVEHIDDAWSGDLGFPHEYVHTTGMHKKGGVLKDEVQKLYIKYLNK